jgi:2-keto-4-pentenoate hydratase/2-oxohepta-3-ene-1,7-dioic acid hydratase in catechol pathway
VRVVRFRDPDGLSRTGFLDGDEVVAVPGDAGRRAVETVLLDGDDALTGLHVSAAGGHRYPLDGLAILSPLHRPSKVLGIGLNYADHAAETAFEAPTEPVVFAKLPSTIVGPYDAIRLPSAAPRRVDYEAELAVVIGRTGRDIAVEDAMRFVLGYTACNDVTARDWQVKKPAGQWTLGKSFDTFLPIGPCIVTADEIPDVTQLRITCTIGGAMLQDDRAGSMIFSIPEVIAYLSRVATLVPGDLILTGTPSGTGSGQTPPRWLTAGEIVEVAVSEIGTLRNPVQEQDATR